MADQQAIQPTIPSGDDSSRPPGTRLGQDNGVTAERVQTLLDVLREIIGEDDEQDMSPDSDELGLPDSEHIRHFVSRQDLEAWISDSNRFVEARSAWRFSTGSTTEAEASALADVAVQRGVQSLRSGVRLLQNMSEQTRQEIRRRREQAVVEHRARKLRDGQAQTEAQALGQTSTAEIQPSENEAKGEITD